MGKFCSEMISYCTLSPLFLKISTWLGTYSKLKTNIFLSDSHHSCQAIPFSRAYFSLNPVRIPIFLRGPHLLIYWQKNINVASIWLKVFWHYIKHWKWIKNFSFLFSVKTLLLSQLGRVNCTMHMIWLLVLH